MFAAALDVYKRQVLALVLPSQNLGQLVTEGNFTLAGGVDLLFVALLQVLSYPFHDPVLTDRGFISDAKVMLKACCWSGALGFLAILAFSLIGVQARLDGLAPSGNVPALVAKSLGFAASFAMLAVDVYKRQSPAMPTAAAERRLSSRCASSQKEPSGSDHGVKSASSGGQGRFSRTSLPSGQGRREENRP